MKIERTAVLWFPAHEAYIKIYSKTKEIFEEFQYFIEDYLLVKYKDLPTPLVKRNVLRIFIDIYNCLMAEFQYLIDGKPVISYQLEEVKVHKLFEKPDKDIHELISFACGNWLTTHGDDVIEFLQQKCYKGTEQRNTIESKL